MEEWTKLADPARFQEILRMLLKYYGDLTSREADFNTHARRAIAEANQASIYVREISRHMYRIIATAETEASSVIARWIHEDGIATERGEHEPGHPVHSITCLTDLVEESPHGPLESFTSSERVLEMAGIRGLCRHTLRLIDFW